jgi:predicted metalloprotease with PDZ domain
VRWDSPAFKAGIGPGMTPVAVNGARTAPSAGRRGQPRRRPASSRSTLLVKEFDLYRTIKLPYYDGLRYPHLERIEGKPDRLFSIYAPKK